MDPEIALIELREMAQDLVWSQPQSSRFAELFIGLDEWLSAGGFLPADWAYRGSGCR